jgi:GMP synthase (glutamine-hydrolysing)
MEPGEARAVVYTHESSKDVGRLGPALRRAGFHLETRLREVREGDVDAPLVVVMGGSMAMYQADQHPFLEDEQRVVEARLGQRRPVLGICLGAQMIAAAAGQRVFKGEPGMVIGVLPVTLTPEAQADPLFAGFEERFEVPHWHGDTHDPVPGAVHLASSARYEQEAFRLGNTLGFQFHPELDAAMYEQWLRDSPEELARTGRTVEEVLARDLPRLAAAYHNGLLMERVAGFFAREVGAGPEERYLFTVEQALPLEARGVVLWPGIPRKAPIVRVGERVELVRPDASRVGGTVKGLGAFGAEGPSLPLLVQLDEGEAQVPVGTEAVTRAPSLL